MIASEQKIRIYGISDKTLVHNEYDETLLIDEEMLEVKWRSENISFRNMANDFLNEIQKYK